MSKKFIILLLVSLISIFWVFQVQAYEFDFGGETVTILTRDSSFAEEHFAEGEELHHLEYVEDKYNCNIEFQLFSLGDGTIRRGVMTGELINTVLSVSSLNVETQGWLQYLLPLNDVLEDEYWEEVIIGAPFRNVKELSTYGSYYYGFNMPPGFMTPVVESRLILWNKDLFEREGLSSIYDLMEEDNWNWDTFLEIAEKATRDTTGNGEIDQWGYGTDRSRLGNCAIHWVFSNDASLVEEIEGEMRFVLNRPEAIEALKFYVDLINESDVTAPNGSFSEGEIAMLNKLYGYLIPDTDFETGVAFMPQGPDADDYVSTSRGYGMLALPATAENPRALIAVVNDLIRFTQDYTTIEEYKNEFVDDYIAMQVHDPESLEIVEKAIFENHEVVRFQQWGQQTDLGWRNTPVGRLQTPIIGSQAQTVGEGIEEIAPAFQASLDDAFDQ